MEMSNISCYLAEYSDCPESGKAVTAKVLVVGRVGIEPTTQGL